MYSSMNNRQGDNSQRKQHLVHDVSRLMRIRDFLRLILSYPMRLGYEKFLKEWIKEVTSFNAYHSLDTEQPDDDLWRWVEHLLSRSPLRYVEGIIPEDITREIKNGGSIFFNESMSEELVPVSSEEAQLKLVPKPILHLATRLAVNQLAQIFESFNSDKIVKDGIIWLSTRNDAEKHIVARTIKEHFQYETEVLVYDASMNQSDIKFGVEELARWLAQNTTVELQTKDSNSFLQRKSRRKRIQRRRGLVLLVDGDGDHKLDLQKVHSFGKKRHPDLIVFITTQSSTQQINELTYNVDLGIRTEDHVLSWKIFCKNVGSELVHSSSSIQKIAVQIVEECRGHLLAIVFAAKSLKDVVDVQIWKHTLEKLCYPNPSYQHIEFNHVREVIVNAFINIIWADVIPERKKPCLIQCLRAFKFQGSMMSKSELFVRWFFEQLIVNEEEAEDTLRKLLEPFILMQFGQYILLTKELKIIFDALLEKKSRDNLTEGGSGLTEPPKDWYSHEAPKFLTSFPIEYLNLSYSGIQSLPSLVSQLAQLKTLSLRGCKQFKQLPPEIVQLHNIVELDLDGTSIAYLPHSLNFPNLRNLLLGNNLDLMEIPPSFFDLMPLLNTLDLSHTSIHDLPRSFFNLQELREFYLNDCELFMELPPEIAQLKSLMTLDLNGTQITLLPNKIKELTTLKSLSLSFFGYQHNSGHGKKSMSYSSSAMIPPALISKLTHLEVLRIDVNLDNQWWHKNFKHILAEIVSLKSLQTLDLYIPDVELLGLMPQLDSHFRYLVGHHRQRIISRVPPTVEEKFKECSPSLRFVNGVDFLKQVKSILYFARAFYLDRHMTINNLSQFGWNNLKRLRLCILAECNEMQSITDGDGPDSELHEYFHLKFLTIFYMKSLRSIINKPTRVNFTFGKLKFLALHTCPELTTIFTMHFLPSLVNLEELIVEDCPKVTSIISCQTSERTSDIFLPRLKKLSLLCIPELVSISNGVHIGRNLEKIGFYYCPKLKSLSTAEFSSEMLKVIRGELEWWEALKWSEAEWGEESRPDKFNHIFFSVDEDLDILTQFTTYEVPSFNEENYSDDWA